MIRAAMMLSVLQEVTEKLLDEVGGPSLVAMWDGGNIVRNLPPEGTFTIGRAPDCDIVIDHKSISRKHAVLFLGRSLEVEDQGSSNKTKLGGVAIAPGTRIQVPWREPIEVGGAIVVVRPPKGLDEGTNSNVGVSMKLDAERLVELVAKTEMSVLLLGETGSGKGYAAEQIHRKSKRAAGPWLHLNCAALPAHLLEAELFGYERGAFTGANQAKEGLLEAAAGGTVFLDEVGELPLPVQAKLLIALEHRAVMRLGALKARPINVRFIAATNAAIDEARGSETFRRDLYYRLAGMPIMVPPLRNRKAEIPALVAKFLSEGSQRLNRAEPVLTKDALASLTQYAWPGNIRELGMVIERALLWAGDTLEAHHLNMGFGALGAELPVSPAAPLKAESPPPSTAAIDRSLQDDLREVEKKRILAALDQCSGNQSRAASLLGIARGTLISRMNEFGLPRPRKG